MNDWFMNLSSSDRRILTLGAVLIIPLLSYQFIISPLEDKIETKSKILLVKQKSVEDLLDIVTEYNRLGGAQVRVKVKRNKSSLLSIIDVSSAKAKIKKNIKRINPDGKNKVRIQFENASFDAISLWLSQLVKKEQISVDSANFRQADKPGLVSGKILLKR